jgi:hypothetical protein
MLRTWVEPHAVVFVACLLIWVMGIVDAAQRSGIAGGTNAAAPNRPSPDPSYARLLTPEAFGRADVVTRRQIMDAWLVGQPELAGPRMLRLIEAGVWDPDSYVRSRALSVLGRVELNANTARIEKRPIITNPASYRPLYRTLFEQLDDPDFRNRQAVILDLLAFEVPPGPDEELERAMLSRLHNEAVPLVRATMILVLAQRAKRGSIAAVSPILAALEDDPTVASRAVSAVQELRTPEALPRLVTLLSSPQAWLRRQVVRALRAFGPSVAPHMPALRARLARG